MKGVIQMKRGTAHQLTRPNVVRALLLALSAALMAMAAGLAIWHAAQASALEGGSGFVAAQSDDGQSDDGQTVDIRIKKIWVGMPVEDVTIHLHRALLPVEEEAQLSDDYIRAKGEDIWHPVGLVATLPRADFVREDGTPLANEPDGSSSCEYAALAGFNQGLPMYVEQDGATYRAVYRLTEDDTSDAYVPAYSSVQPDGTSQPDDNIFIDSGTMVVANTTAASNTANIAAVKQLIGRTWLESDVFRFKMVPLGKASYDASGEMRTELDGEDGVRRAVLVPGSAATIPMPQADESRLATFDADARVSYADATVHTSVVAEGERLARFGAIEFSASDLVYDPQDNHLQGDFFYELSGVVPDASDGFTYDERTHVVHVRVRENRTDQLQVSIAYDETDQSNVATGTQFTPVFTNRYAVQGMAEVQVNKHVMGRSWQAGDAFDYSLRAMGGAPFGQWDDDEVVRLDHEGKALADGQMRGEDYFLAQGRQVVTRDGALRMRVAAGDRQDTADALEGAFADMRFTLDDLHLTVGEGGAKDPRDHSGTEDQVENSHGIAAAGLKYGRFMYAVSETAVHCADGDLLRDADTEYAQVFIVDNGDGTFCMSVNIFEDRYAIVPRFTPGTDPAEPARAVAFVAQAMRSIQVEKRWRGVVDADVEVKLQQAAGVAPAEADWSDVPGRTLVFPAAGMQATHDGAVAQGAFDALPMFLADGDDLDLNDPPLSYRVVEVTEGAGKFVSTYGADGSASPVVAEPGVVQVVANESTYTSSGTARVSVVVELTGRTWLSANPEAVNYSAQLPEGDVFEFDLVPLGKGDYSTGELPLEDGRVCDGTLVKDASGEPVVAGIPLPNVPAFARTEADGEHRISESQRLADFGNVNLSLADMTRLDDGRMVGDYFYEIVETPDADALAWIPDPLHSGSYLQVGTDGKVFGAEGANNLALRYADADDAQRRAFTWIHHGLRYDRTKHELRIHFEDNGTGSFVPEVSYDGKPVGHAVPVFVNAYDAQGECAATIVKRIEGREWRSTDQFEFRVTAIGGLGFDPVDDQSGTGNVGDAVWTTGIMNDGSQQAGGLPATAQLANGDRAMSAGANRFHLADLTPGSGGSPASGQFVYQLQEIDPSRPATATNASPVLAEKVADLDYDDDIVYLRIGVRDNFDGTLATTLDYFHDAACLSPLADEDGQPYRAWVDTSGRVVDEGTDGAVAVPAAFFCNEIAATNAAQVAAVEQLVGRVWLDSDAPVVELRPLGKAAYGADGAIVTEDYELNGQLVALAVCEEGSAATIPMPESGVTGEGAGRVAVATASRATPVVAESEHLAPFADIRFSLADIAYNAAEQRMAGDFYYLMSARVPDDAAGLRYDTRQHLVHVIVRETGPNKIGCYVRYDETDAADMSTGTQFTPVFTNRYEASAQASVAVSAYLAGRDWQLGDSFDFELHNVGSSPFVAADGANIAYLPSTASAADVEGALASGANAMMPDGALRMRLTADTVQSGASALSGRFQPMAFSSGDLLWSVGSDGAPDARDLFSGEELCYGDESAVPEGLRYGVFIYAVSELAGADAAMRYDSAVRYAIFTVVDRGDGTLDVQCGFYEDRFGKKPYLDAGNGLPLTTARFTNTTSSDDFVTITANVAWADAAGAVVAGPAGATVRLHLLGREAPEGPVLRVETADVADTDGDGTWTASWTVPKALVYELTEELADCYLVSIEPAGASDARAFSVVNRAIEHEGATIDAQVSLAWDDDADRDGLRGECVVELQRKVDDGPWQAAGDAAECRVSLGASDESVSKIWPDMPHATQEGTTAYRIVPVAVPDGYECIVSLVQDGSYAVRLVHAPQTVAVQAGVSWLDFDNVGGTRPGSVDLLLFANGQPVGAKVAVGPSANGSWSYTWPYLPANDADGAVEYSVAQMVNGYDAHVQRVESGPATVAYRFANMLRSARKAVQADVVWRDAAGADFTPSAAQPTPGVTLQLVKHVGSGMWLVAGSDKSIAANDAAPSVSWDNLVAYEAGQEVFYSVTQKGLAGYTPLYAETAVSSSQVHFAVINRANGDPTDDGSGNGGDGRSSIISLAAPEITLSGAKGLVYDGKPKKPAVASVKVAGRVVPASGYDVSYANNVRAGTATVKVTGKGAYVGTATTTFAIAKAKNPMIAKAKKKTQVVKAAKLKKSKHVIRKAAAFKVKGAQGKVVFSKKAGNKKIAVSKAGKITVKKGLKPGSYKLKVRVKAAGTANYQRATKVVKLTVRVK